MISTFSRKTNLPATDVLPRRLAAMALTLLFAFCVLVASAPHRHAGDATIATARFSRAHHDSHAPALAPTLKTADTACPLCDWLYAPTLPAAAPVLPPVATPARRFAPPVPAPAGRLLAAAPSRSSSRAPPAAV